MINRALISVYDKTGVVALAKKLVELGIEIISTGGTARKLIDSGIKVTQVAAITNSPEILDGRVKTLHPVIHGGILAKRNNKEHLATLKEHDIPTIDMVVGNLYPFAATIAQPNVTLDEALENIDIGGPTMIRAAAKNFKDVLVVVDPSDYDRVLEALNTKVDVTMRQQLATKAFAHTAQYDSLIANYLSDEVFPTTLNRAYAKAQELRYGENPHQQAAIYSASNQEVVSILNSKQHQGKELSYNNINDADAALRMVLEFEQPAAIAVKHTSPCGAAIANDILTAYKRAHDADPVSIFGGIVAVNREIDQALAAEMSKIFLDVIIAPSFTQEALDIFSKKKNLRLLEVINIKQDVSPQLEMRSVLGGMLIQSSDNLALAAEDWQQVAGESASPDVLADMQFAWKICKHVKSNAIVVAKNGQTLGCGGGQVNRIDAAKYALENGAKECKGAVLASDGLFPFPDVVETAAQFGIKAIVQPGGSIRDKLSIEAAQKNNIVMIHTGVRHFKH